MFLYSKYAYEITNSKLINKLSLLKNFSLTPNLGQIKPFLSDGTFTKLSQTISLKNSSNCELHNSGAGNRPYYLKIRTKQRI